MSGCCFRFVGRVFGRTRSSIMWVIRAWDLEVRRGFMLCVWRRSSVSRSVLGTHRLGSVVCDVSAPLNGPLRQKCRAKPSNMEARRRRAPSSWRRSWSVRSVCICVRVLVQLCPCFFLVESVLLVGRCVLSALHSPVLCRAPPCRSCRVLYSYFVSSLSLSPLVVCSREPPVNRDQNRVRGKRKAPLRKRNCGGPR